MSRRDMDRLSDGTPIVWRACGCTIWPISLGGSGRCGKCGTAANVPMTKPREGKARPLRGFEHEEVLDYRSNYGDD